MEPYIVRFAQPKDAQALEKLNEAFNGSGTAGAEMIAASLAASAGEIVCVAEANGGTLLGFCCGQVHRSFCYKAPTGEITELYVAPQHRRKGVAQALIHHMEQALLCHGVVDIHLLTGDDNDAAQRLYKSCGYAISGEVHLEKELEST